MNQLMRVPLLMALAAAAVVHFLWAETASAYLAGGQFSGFFYTPDEQPGRASGPLRRKDPNDIAQTGIFRATQGSILSTGAKKLLIGAVAAIDPSIAYNLEVTNTTSEPGDYSLFFDLPVLGVGANTLSGTLTVELIDANSNGQAFLTGGIGATDAIQDATLFSSNPNSAIPVGPAIGASFTSAGMQVFPLGPMSGPTLATADMLTLNTAFTLSPGDTARITSQFIIDEGTGVPFVDIPELPDPAGGPYYNVINVDSSDSSLGDDVFIGSQTQLNVFDGGSIGEQFNFNAYLNNQLNDSTSDIEVNITGGTVGHQFMALSGTTVNISGGATSGVFLAGSYSGQSTDVAVNITGGSVGAGSGGQLQAYAGSVVNVIDGTLGILSGDGGVVNIGGGTFGSGSLQGGISANLGSVVNIAGGAFSETPSSPGGVVVYDNSVVNISGGSFTTSNRLFSARDGSEVNLFGTEFLLNGEEVDGLAYGMPFEVTNREMTLSGTLADGSPFSIDLSSNDPFPAQGDWVDLNALLTITLSLPGDYNHDGTVDAADYVVWRTNRGAEMAMSNDTSPGSVTQWDYEVWVANFGRTWLGGGSGFAVPEPTTGAFLLLGVAGCFSNFFHRRASGVHYAATKPNATSPDGK